MARMGIERSAKPPASYLILIILLAAIGFFLSLGGTDIVTSHEARVAQTARLMAATGWPWNDAGVDVPAVEFYRNPDGRKYFRPAKDKPPIRVNPWIVPVMNNEIRLQKPPLPYWLSASMYRMMDYSELASRLPDAILGFLATFLMIDLTRRLFSRREAIWAGLIWVSTFFIVESYRKVMADPELAFFTLLCVWSWIVYARGGSPWLLILFYISFAFGNLAKAPVIFLHVVVAIGAYSICYRSWPRGRILWHLAGIAIVLLIFLPWPLHVLHRLPHAIDLWRYESVGEFADNIEDARPWWFYLPNIFYIPVPWTVVTIIGAADAIRRVRRKTNSADTAFPPSPGTPARGERSRIGEGRGGGPSAFSVQRSAFHTDPHPNPPPEYQGRGQNPEKYAPLFPLAWFLVTVLIFSFSNLKKDMYLLPMMPAAVLLTVQGLIALTAWLRVQKLRPAAIIIQIGMAVAALIFAAVATRTAVSLFITLPAIILAILAIILARQRNISRWMLFQSAAASLAIVAMIVFFEGQRDNNRSARQVADAVTPMLHSPDTAIHNLPEEVSVYLPLGVPQDSDASHQIIFTRKPHTSDVYKPQFPGWEIKKNNVMRLPNLPKGNPWSVVILKLEKE